MTGRVKRPRVRQVLAALRALSTEIDRLDQVGADRFRLNRTDLRALDLVHSRGPLGPTELAHLLGLTTGGMTSVIDRLEQAGYVRRTPGQKDRRRLVVTPAVAERDAEIFGDLLSAAMAAIAGYDDQELEVILRFLEDIRRATATQADALVRGKEVATR
ncbi:MAG TPA: MarR family transcriptional regulator [Candidatus Dormibacteraeota bacterium]|nr:MarR family transcriptional regulator [Candidatus Dormibacteraeota bacterium]